MCKKVGNLFSQPTTPLVGKSSDAKALLGNNESADIHQKNAKADISEKTSQQIEHIKAKELTGTNHTKKEIKKKNKRKISKNNNAANNNADVKLDAVVHRSTFKPAYLADIYKIDKMQPELSKRYGIGNNTSKTSIDGILLVAKDLQKNAKFSGIKQLFQQHRMGAACFYGNQKKKLTNTVNKSSMLALGETHDVSHNWAILAQCIEEKVVPTAKTCVVCEMPVIENSFGKVDQKATSETCKVTQNLFDKLNDDKTKIDPELKAIAFYLLADGAVGTGASQTDNTTDSVIRKQTEKMLRDMKIAANLSNDEQIAKITSAIKQFTKDHSQYVSQFSLSDNNPTDETMDNQFELNKTQIATERIYALKCIFENKIDMKFADPTKGDDFANKSLVHEELGNETTKQIKNGKFVVLMSGIAHAALKESEYSSNNVKVSPNSMDLVKKNNGALIVSDVSADKSLLHKDAQYNKEDSIKEIDEIKKDYDKQLKYLKLMNKDNQKKIKKNADESKERKLEIVSNKLKRSWEINQIGSLVTSNFYKDDDENISMAAYSSPLRIYRSYEYE